MDGTVRPRETRRPASRVWRPHRAQNLGAVPGAISDLALLFVAFDMEMVFMFPWAVVFKRLGLVAFLDMFVFIAILISAIAFAWKEGAFDWER